jgi:hypothetical protein
MANQLYVKRKFVWRFENFTRENLNCCKSYLSINSDEFEMLIGENNTKW